METDMSFYIYHPAYNAWLSDDYADWTNSFFDAARFPSREQANEQAEQLQGMNQGAYVMDDGIPTEN
jgi:hypothetical protein